jgi:hypothetical protein
MTITYQYAYQLVLHVHVQPAGPEPVQPRRLVVHKHPKLGVERLAHLGPSGIVYGRGLGGGGGAGGTRGGAGGRGAGAASPPREAGSESERRAGRTRLAAGALSPPQTP